MKIALLVLFGSCLVTYTSAFFLFDIFIDGTRKIAEDIRYFFSPQPATELFIGGNNSTPKYLRSTNDVWNQTETRETLDLLAKDRDLVPSVAPNNAAIEYLTTPLPRLKRSLDENVTCCQEPHWDFNKVLTSKEKSCSMKVENGLPDDTRQMIIWQICLADCVSNERKIKINQRNGRKWMIKPAVTALFEELLGPAAWRDEIISDHIMKCNYQGAQVVRTFGKYLPACDILPYGVFMCLSREIMLACPNQSNRQSCKTQRGFLQQYQQVKDFPGLQFIKST